MENGVNKENQDVQENQVMRLRDAFKKYLICLAAFIIVVAIGVLTDNQTLFMLAFFLYFGIGIYLNRVVLRRLVEWHPMHNTIGDVFSTKLRHALFWPIAYFSLFILLGISKVL